MTEPLKERVELRARELYTNYWSDGWTQLYEDISLQNKLRWLRLAKAVMISELRTRRDCIIDFGELENNELSQRTKKEYDKIFAELNELEKGEI